MYRDTKHKARRRHDPVANRRVIFSSFLHTCWQKDLLLLLNPHNPVAAKPIRSFLAVGVGKCKWGTYPWN